MEPTTSSPHSYKQIETIYDDNFEMQKQVEVSGKNVLVELDSLEMQKQVEVSGKDVLVELDNLEMQKQMLDSKRIAFEELNHYPLLVSLGFLEVEPDADGLYGGAILPASHYMVLWRTSWITLGAGIYALYRRYYDIAVCIMAVFLTSIVYWIYPDYGWRRYLDVATVHVALIYQFTRAVGSTNMVPYYVVMCVGILSFFIGVYFHKRSPWLSTYFHSHVHIIGNVGNFVLTTGTLKPFGEWLH